MNGHESKRQGYWRIVLELGEQAGRRCPVCVDRRGKGRRYWADEDAPDACPQCGGELEDFTARRQELLPEKYTRKADAERARHDELRERERGDYVAPVDLTLGDYLEARWLPALGAEELAESTVEVYREHVGRIVPQIGTLPLQKLNRNDVAVMAAHLAATIRPKTGKPLSPATRRSLLGVLQHALDDAVSAGLLRSNPAAGVKKPRVRRPEMHTWTAAELATFLRATREDRMSPLWHLLALTGIRRGEALGLQWAHVDLEHGRLALQRQRKIVRYNVVETQLKTDKPRAVSLDADTVAVLRRQSQQQLDDAAEWKAAWVGGGHVFTREDGAPWHPDRVRVLFQQAVKAVDDVSGIRMHDLRHTWATLALRAGVHPKVVQERLGHANIRITLDTYSHVLPDMQESAAELVASVVASALAELEE
jgi:integrase